ncbi:Hypothetical protein Minf_1800 [Methylacidiphilum infernorum V4]|uniref:Uncharacterized protein n=1 Tax=Methylacidiphilum infernorum (isolate V4) TaxID=481448 RepID=B3DXE5_METI4|nr:Hypothetical protein Minf_1800 [Methylacidiphilum infernorum V4]
MHPQCAHIVLSSFVFYWLILSLYKITRSKELLHPKFLFSFIPYR